MQPRHPPPRAPLNIGASLPPPPRASMQPDTCTTGTRLGDGGRERGLAVIDMPNGAHIDVRLDTAVHIVAEAPRQLKPGRLGAGLPAGHKFIR